MSWESRSLAAGVRTSRMASSLNLCEILARRLHSFTQLEDFKEIIP